jgi:hypothetical protein
VPLAQGDEVVGTLAPDRSDQPFREAVLPRRAWGNGVARRRLSRYMRRWLVERFFAWIQWQRRILVRWEYHTHNWRISKPLDSGHFPHFLTIDLRNQTGWQMAESKSARLH